MRTRMCHWAPGSSDWRLNTWTTVLCAVGPLQVWNFNLPENGTSFPILGYKTKKFMGLNNFIKWVKEERVVYFL
jgi:hypothetical protein